MKSKLISTSRKKITGTGTSKNYWYHNGTNLPVPKEVKKSKPKLPVRNTEESQKNVLLL
jgi:hypothetical protein